MSKAVTSRLTMPMGQIENIPDSVIFRIHFHSRNVGPK
jgi:hypothetical protein